MTNYWQDLHHLFDTDDGSLPDIFFDELSGDQVCTIYAWVMTQTKIYENPTLWDIIQKVDVPIRSIADPASLVVDKKGNRFNMV